ncbi:MAG: AAA family ATPase [Acidobacteria bacterium]|nr:AAA family ATPase [Acidobacteriota bacterium]
MSGIFIKEVRVRNFRCLKAVDVELAVLTVLIGQNNAGKTSFLSAVFAAIGAGQRVLTEDDIFLTKNETSIPKDRPVVIDILIRPANGAEIISTFLEGSPWLELWGNAVTQDDEACDFVAIRTEFTWNAVKGEFVTDRRFLRDWHTDSTKWASSKPMEKVGPVRADQIEPLGVYMLDARRDIVEDLRSRGSFWSKMASEHGLPTKEVERIEALLSDINDDIVESSNVLSHIKTHLDAFNDTISCEKGSVAVTPLARHLRDLSRGMDVVLSTEGAPAFSLQKQGMGTRSLGSILIFSAFMTWKQKQSAASAVHPVTALEEPESHLHPQAQRALLRQIRQMPGQKLISTHSPYICGQVEVATMRHFSKVGEETTVSRLEVGNSENQLKSEDLRQIDRQVMNTRGDMLFARTLVFFEGETEEQAIPDFAERYWNKHPNDMGFSFIGVGGDGKYLPFIRMAKAFGIPWFLFSDGEPNTVRNVNVALTNAGEDSSEQNDRVIVLANGQNFEQYLAAMTPATDLVNVIIDNLAQNATHRAVLDKSWAEKQDLQSALAEELKRAKTQYGSLVGKKLGVPPALISLFGKIDTQLKLTTPQESAQLGEVPA